MGARWHHFLGQGGVRFEIALSDGRRFRNDCVRWVVNRLVRIPNAYLLTAEESDASYAEQEWRALLCSVLQSLHRSGVTVLEPPDPYSLSGRWRSPAEWSFLAARAGLPVRPWRWHEPLLEQPPARGAAAWALVIGQTVLSDVPLSAELLTACRRLAGISQMSVLHIGLTLHGARATFSKIVPLADLRIAGERSLDPLIALLGE